MQWQCQEFSFGAIPQEWSLGDSGVRGEVMVGSLEDKVPQKLKQFADIVYIF